MWGVHTYWDLVCTCCNAHSFADSKQHNDSSQTEPLSSILIRNLINPSLLSCAAKKLEVNFQSKSQVSRSCIKRCWMLHYALAHCTVCIIRDNIILTQPLQSWFQHSWLAISIFFHPKNDYLHCFNRCLPVAIFIC